MLCFSTILVALLVTSTSAVATERRLAAASRRSGLSVRSSEFRLSHEAELSYSEGNIVEGQEGFATNVKVTSGSPILVLEEFEHLITGVECTAKSIILTLPSLCAEDAFPRFSKLVGGHIITSHTGCNSADEHQAYKVSYVDCESENSLFLQVTRTKWRDAFESLAVEMGPSSSQHNLRKHQEAQRLAKRQQSGNGGDISSALPSIPVASPTSVDTNAPTSVHLQDSETITNQALPLPSDVPLTLSCNLCEVHGSIDLAWAQFNVTVELESRTFDIEGYGTAVATNLGGWFDLATNVSQSGSFMYGLIDPKLQSASIRVPGLGSASVALGPFLAGGFAINTGLALTRYGLAMQVADGAEVAFGFANGQDPTAAQVGFDSATVQVLPWNAELEIPEISLYLGIRWTVQAAFRLLESEISGEGDAIDFLNDHNAALSFAAYVDTPIINASVTANVDSTCNTSSSQSTDNIRIDLRESLAVGAYFMETNSASEIPNLTPPPFYKELTLDALDFTGSPSKLCLTFDAGQKRYTLADKKSQAAVLQICSRAFGVWPVLALASVFWTFVLFG